MCFNCILQSDEQTEDYEVLFSATWHLGISASPIPYKYLYSTYLPTYFLLNPQPLHTTYTCRLENMIEPSQRLRRAVRSNDASLVKRIVANHPALVHNPDHSADGLANSNLHLAASLGYLQVCKILVRLDHEKPTPALNDLHQTALMLAAGAGHTEVVHFLAENDPATILRRDSRGRDAIMEASVGGHDTVLQILLTYVPGGAESAVTNADHEGNTALHFASSNGHLLVLRTLLAAGADADKKNMWSWNAVAYSATVQAEVYFKNLVVDVEKRKRAKQETDECRKGGAAVRLVDHDASG
ncbi:ankyrin repeat-containing domain protein [Astrocystis sublimbata]|nr:ankyrin repeat-containing domain protein [Astrocystis sublimbata]